MAEHAEALLVIGLGADFPVEAGHRFHVVVEDVGLGGKDAVDGAQIAVEIRSKDFDLGFRQGAVNGFDSAAPVFGAAVGEFIAVDAGEDNIAEIHALCLPGDVFGFQRIGQKGSLAGIGLGDAAKAAATGTKVAKNHEGGGAAGEALVEVGTAGAFANRVKVQRAEFALEFRDGPVFGLGLAEKFRQAGTWGFGDLDQHCGAASS
jgi:hypothetical protein